LYAIRKTVFSLVGRCCGVSSLTLTPVVKVTILEIRK